MRTNPGGQLSAENIVGRDLEVAQIWESLETQSVYMNAERRIGKTSILTLLGQPRTGWTVVRRDLENLRTSSDFATAVYKDVDGFLTGRQRKARRAIELLKSIQGTEIAGVVKLPASEPTAWKLMLERCVQDLTEAFEHDGHRLLFLWDEVPFMLSNIAKDQSETVAMEVLDTLRYLRQTYPCVRMVLTGSIGLHHVLAKLKRSGYGNSPINDMLAFEVTPLREVDGARLAQKLLEGEQVHSADLGIAALTISRSVDHFPFYIQHIVRALKTSRRSADAVAIDEQLTDRLCAATDPWELRHYRERIATYYGSDEPLALAILDAVAIDGPMSLEQIFSAAKTTLPISDKEHVRALLVLLQRDHYVRRFSDSQIDFAFGLIKRWWRLERDLIAAASTP